MKFILSDQELIFPPEQYSCLYFYAEWLILHKKMVTMLQKMEIEFPSIQLIAVDIDRFRAPTLAFNIVSIPSLVLLNGKKEVKKANGIMMTSALRAFFNRSVNNKKEENDSSRNENDGG